MILLIPPHPLTNFELEICYQNEPRFNGVFSRKNLPKKIKNGAYIINLDEYADLGSHWIALISNKNDIVCLDSSGVEYIPEEFKKFVEKLPDCALSSVSQNKNIIAKYKQTIL